MKLIIGILYSSLAGITVYHFFPKNLHETLQFVVILALFFIFAGADILGFIVLNNKRNTFRY